MTPDEALEVLKQELIKVRAEQPYPVDDETDLYMTPKGMATDDSSPAPELARKWSQQLLQAAHAYDSTPGCPLCT